MTESCYWVMGPAEPEKPISDASGCWLVVLQTRGRHGVSRPEVISMKATAAEAWAMAERRAMIVDAERRVQTARYTTLPNWSTAANRNRAAWVISAFDDNHKDKPKRQAEEE